MKVSIILPTYNEKNNILNLIESIFSNLAQINVEKEIIIVDDNSPDQTGKTVQKNYQDNKNVMLLIRLNERGLASAIRFGIEKSSGDVIIVMDTDFNHNPAMIPQMIDFLKYYDCIIGSRFSRDGGMKDLSRYLGSYIFNLFVRIVLRTQIQDNTSGFFSIRREKLYEVNFDNIFYGYGDYYFRFLFFARKQRLTLLEVPVFYELRKFGESKSNLFKLLFKYSYEILKLKVCCQHV